MGLAVSCICICSALAQTQGGDDRTDPPEIGDRADNRPAKDIQDNSFLIEEAYNQEPGVVQSFATLRDQGRDRFFAFTQESPVGSQTHQLSYFLRRKRDASLDMPDLMFHALPLNIRAGALPPASPHGRVMLSIPLNVPRDAM